MIVLSNILIIIAMVVIVCGFVGIIRSKGVYAKLLTSALIDTAGLLIMLIALSLRADSIAVALKILFIALATFITAPLISHKIGRSSFISGHREVTEEVDE